MSSPASGRARHAPTDRTAAAPQEIRIIGGTWKRTRLPVPRLPGLRPTPDRVRETLFNWLGQDLTGWRVVDAFAGTGALGLEAASRGAAEVLLVEQDGVQVEALRTLVARLQAQGRVQVERGNAITALARLEPESRDLVFLDPPYAAGLHGKALAAAAGAVRAGGWIYLEAPQPWADDTLLAAHALAVQRHMKAGAVHAHLLQKAGAEAET